MPYLGVFGLEFTKKELLSIWSQHPWICQVAKYREIMKMTKSGTKIALLGYFWAKISKSYSHIWNQSLWFSAIVKFCEETKTPKFGTKNALFECFWARIF